MEKLVKLENNKPVTTTLAIAEGLGVEHRRVLDLARTYLDDLEEVSTSTVETRKLATGGRPTTYFVLEEIQATFLFTLMNNDPKIVEFKKRLVKEFYRQRNIIERLIARQKDPDWRQIRQDGKLLHNQKTDVIADFIEYAIGQGSKSARHYYANLAKMENAALFIVSDQYKNVRDALSSYQLATVQNADIVIERAIKEGMEQGMHYKEIYQLAKERVIAFAELVGRSPVHDLLPQAKEID